MAKDLLLEIGTEEIPARFMNNALEQLKTKTETELQENRLEYETVATYGTPRRLAVVVSGLAEKQADLVTEVKGPSKKVAFDEEGNPTKAVQGFARGQGVDVADLIVRETDNGEYVFAVVKDDGRSASEILPSLLKSIVLSLNFPKPMRWGYQKMRFARPIRWLVALFGSDVVNFEIAGVTSGRESRGHRFLCEENVVLEHAGEYLKKLEEAYVIVDQNRRREEIWRQIRELARAQGGMVEENPELLEEVTYLLEYPTALCGTFEEKYLKLPDEVLITPMQEHQRYFPVKDARGNLLNKFITVRNGTSEYIDIVTAGNEKVLKARLADAEFFYQEDIKQPLETKVETLKNVVFQEKLGTIYEKVERIKELTAYLSDLLAPEYKEAALRTAHLSKADLETHMVYEFPELQGIMGGYYAAHDGEPELVWRGIREHWQPRFAGDAVPETVTGTLVSIADKIDTIVGCFGIGIQPTGSQDPYALRRQAQGICQIILQKQFALSLRELVERAFALYDGKLTESKETVTDNVLQFFKQRIETIFQDMGISYDTVDAVLAAGWDKPLDALQRAQALEKFRREEQFEALSTAFKRASNLAEKAGTGTDVDESLFQEEVERKLWQAVARVEEKLERSGDYYQMLQEIASLRQPVDDFFEQVMVMAEDERIRENRLALLKHVRNLVVEKTGIKLDLVS
ncbi:MAG: glycine--tRNA ligase subunit beta [Thermoanaerobacteraceae bacterium]|nr:glycine--tRNA ligase subunit beta [Thermoanaerobacteraceae bacterium]